jgi:hypothetical protein
MSAKPSPSKSPVPAMIQEPGTAPTPTGETSVAPFMNQIATPPLLVLRQRMSAKPSPLKSPVPTIDQSVTILRTSATELTARLNTHAAPILPLSH